MHLLRCGGKRTRPDHPLLTRRALPEGAVTIPVTERMALTRTNWPDVDDVVALNADTEVMRYLWAPGLPVNGGPATSWAGS